MKRVFVSGATGFLGSNLSLKLAQNGYIVHGLYRTEEKIQNLIHPNIKLFKGSVNNKDSLLNAMYSCEGLFHTAAYVKIWTKTPHLFYETNIKGTQNVIEAAKDSGVKRAVFTSSAGVLGPSNKKTVTEESVNSESYMNDYENSKLEADKIITKANTANFETIIVYPTRIFGPGPVGSSNSITTMIKNYMEGHWHFIPGNGKVVANYVFIDDVIDGHIIAFTKGIAGEKYVLGGTTISYLDFFSLIKEISGKNYRLFKVPPLIMQLIAFAMIIRTHLTGAPPLVTKNFLKKALSNYDVSSQKACTELEYRPTPIKKALEITIHWINNKTVSHDFINL